MRINENTMNNNNKGSETMIEEIAEVKRVGQGYAEVIPQSASGCASCSAKAGCSSKASVSLPGLLSARKSQPQTIRVYNPVYAKPGDRVVVGIKPNTLLKGSLLAYLVPLLALLFAAVLGGELFRLLGLNAEAGSILSGIFGLVLGFKAVSLWMQRAMPAAEFEAVILRVAGAEAQPVSLYMPT